MPSTEMTRRQFHRSAAIAAAGLSAALQATAAEPKAPGLKVTVIGDSTCIPDPGHDVASLLINGRHLIDTGWYAALKMREYGFDPLALESIWITHFHHDHYIGLPQLLFFVGLKQRAAPLTLAGPAEHLPQILKFTNEFLQIARFPQLTVNLKVVPLTPGDGLELSDVRVESFGVNHVSGKQQPEQAMAYKVSDKASGACFVYSGDTSHYPPLAEFARGVPLLVHDGSHTPAKAAAEVAKQAGVGRLALIHYNQARGERLLQDAQAVFANSELAKQGQTWEIPGKS